MVDDTAYIELHEQLQAVAESLPAPVFVLDYEGRYVSVFGGQARSQYDEGKSLIGCYMQEVLPEDKWRLFLSVVRKAIDSGTLQTCDYQLASTDVSVTDNDGPTGTQWFQGRVYPVKAKKGGMPTAVWLAINISEQKYIERRLQRLAEVDDLTGVYNRRFFMKNLEKEFEIARRRNRELSLICMDVDHFKSINDRFGHLVGDQALQHLAASIQKQLRGEDILARTGGEEFAILCLSTGLQDAFYLAERVREAVEAVEIKTEQGSLKMTISLGIADVDRRDENMHSFISRADKVLYAAKDAGRNRSLCAGGRSQLLTDKKHLSRVET